MSVLIRNITEKDFKSILEINRESIPNVFELDKSEISVLLELCKYSKVEEVNEEIAGYIFVLERDVEYDGEEYNWLCDNRAEDFLYIDQIAIKAKWKETGLGAKLYQDQDQDLELYAINNKYRALVCEVNYKPLNHASMTFHEKMGFKKIHKLGVRGMVVSLLTKQVLF